MKLPGIQIASYHIILILKNLSVAPSSFKLES
jgi:hypothetical protein